MCDPKRVIEITLCRRGGMGALGAAAVIAVFGGYYTDDGWRPVVNDLSHYMEVMCGVCMAPSPVVTSQLRSHTF